MSEKSPDRAAMPSTPPGWFPDPRDPNTLRYWDGDRWTENIAPRLPVHAPAQRDNNALIGWGIVTGILFPIVGFIIGIVLLTRDDKWGIWIMLGSVGATILWFNALQPDPTPIRYSQY